MKKSLQKFCKKNLELGIDISLQNFHCETQLMNEMTVIFVFKDFQARLCSHTSPFHISIKNNYVVGW